MENADVSRLLGLLAIMLTGANAFGWLAQRAGQPAVLGELVAGVLLGSSAFGLLDPHETVLHFMGELGIVILLFEIGLETDIRRLLGVGVTSATVAIVGVILPFALGYVVCRWWGLERLVSIFAGASLTATSVGITARVLSDLGRLQDEEGQIIVGAAVIDDVIGLVILTVVAAMSAGDKVTFTEIAQVAVIAFGFLVVTLAIGNFVVPPLLRLTRYIDRPGTATIAALIVAFGLAWVADAAGSSMIVGAFAAGILLARTPQAKEIERGVASIGHFFVPLFFVVVGAAVDVSGLDQNSLCIGSLLLVVAIVTKFAAGFAPFWFKGRKSVIGVGMIPRGEVGLIFAQMGLSTGLLDSGLFSAITLMVMATTFMAPPLLRMLFPHSRTTDTGPKGIDELVMEA